MTNHIIYINFRSLFDKCLRETIQQQRIRYRTSVYVSYKESIVLNRYNLVIDTLLNTLQNIDKMIENIKTNNKNKNSKILTFDSKVSKYNLPSNYDGYSYYVPYKKFVYLNTRIDSFKFFVKKAMSIYERFKKEICVKEIVKGIKKYIETETIEKKSKNISMSNVKLDIDVLLEENKDNWEKYIEDNIYSLDNILKCFLSKSHRTELRLIRDNENIIKEFDEYYKTNYGDDYEKINISRVNIYKEAVKKITKIIKEELFFIQNRLTYNEINDMFDYIYSICDLEKTDKVDIFDDSTVYTIMSNVNVIPTTYLTDLNNDPLRPRNLKLKTFHTKEFNDIKNITVKKLFEKEYSKQATINNTINNNISIYDLIRNIKNQSPYTPLEKYNDFKNKNLFFKYIVDIDPDRKINMFIEYSQDMLYNSTISDSIMKDFKQYNLYSGIKPIDETNEYNDKFISEIIKKYSYKHFKLK